MSIRVALHHLTHYRFDRPVTLYPHEIRLKPAAHSRTPVLSYSLQVEPAGHFINWQQDPYGNFVARLVFPETAAELKVTVDLVADLAVINPFDFWIEPYAETFPFEYPPALGKELAPYLERETGGPLFDAWVDGVRRELLAGGNTTNFLVAINQRLQRDVSYLVRLEAGIQEPEETLEKKSGSCRDSAWLLAQILRHCGLATRFASGYLIQLKADQKSLDGPSGPQEDFTDLHAWCEVYIPGAGWIGLDPTSGLFAGEGHIPLACTALPSSAAPVIGATSPCKARLQFEMKVTRVSETPRVTKPYSAEQWEAILALGDAVDLDLEANDVRLTQGGEPTFVSIDDMEGPEWNTQALSPAKLGLARLLHRRLANRFAPGALLHFGQGKWYPGEPLPRWALGIYWRADGRPIWQDSALIADATNPREIASADVLRFIGLLATRLGIPRGFLVPAYEDAWNLLQEEQKLSTDVDPLEANLGDSMERQRLATLLERGLSHVAGYALPLKAVPNDNPSEPTRWVSSRWPLRRGRAILIPGDSPLGYRLPLDSLPWELKSGVELDPAVDPLEQMNVVSAEALALAQAEASPSGENPDATEVIHTALCIQAREGMLHLFMPPVEEIDDYLALVGKIEATARQLAMPVAIEGYTPPFDTRVKVLNVTPDPGVIEVNIHPASSWRQLVDNTRLLYAEARETRLGTEKFMLDGRHTGTGGGNHVTLGGITPRDSPLLRRPDLLQSLITYWQNHPSLSYLFSSAFIGPTSQSPRVDEARDDNLYELEIAFQQLESELAKLDSRDVLDPGLIDRLLRNHLVDLTGNTHRAEFSIDKLYSPQGGTGRLGLLEFRAFEMPPHAQMSLAQMLLLRALVARFWREPFRGRLIAWDTELHDRWLLPHVIAQDIRDVARDLQRSGYAFDEAWFAPFLEFRFPRLGSVNYDGIEIELRQAIEPWNVLGEEIASSGTARYVDSSVERLQVKVSGMTGGRHVVTCNGRPLPLHSTGTHGEFVAGVKFKAWDPGSALHPTIPAQAPLTFDLVDTWSGKALGGCTYHVSHPGGRNYETFPVNANEAEARRRARFWDHGHTPGPVDVKVEPVNPKSPFTLDLRRRPG
jgi:uncharacterized protein (DUF2126 family)/transglutaminase-like putative cysteine protease